MLRSLIDDSVMADLAGAERQRSRAADPKRGPELFWGNQTDSSAPYNSLSHAFRVVFGRWESGRMAGWPAVPVPTADAPIPSGDPGCGVFGPIDLLTRALDPGTSARWEDRRVRKPEQQRAVQLVDKTGIVIPREKLETADMATVKAAVKNQLILSAVQKASLPSALDPAFGKRKQAIEAQVDGMKDADLRFALDRSFGAFRLLTGAAASTPTLSGPGAPDPAGVPLAPAAEVDPALSGLGGAVVSIGMPRKDATVEIGARVGPGQAASECPEYQAAGVLAGAANMGKVAAFQDSFMIGETFRRRLSQVRQLTAAATFPKPSAVPVLADAGSTELRSWTGPGLVIARLQTNQNVIQARLFGFLPEDFGVKTPQEMKGRVKAVWGKPWVADCATGLRQSCPASFKDNYVQDPLSESVDAENPDYANHAGADGRMLALEFPVTGGVPSFNPSATGLGSAAEQFLYLVAAGDPKDPIHGKVLATVVLRREGTWTYALASDYQKKLANDLFGLDGRWAVKGPKVGEHSSTSPPGYCVENVPRDFFVPLENELTSDSDSFESSWKHYLTLAKEAAGHADALGEELIRKGLEQDYRREAALEEVGKICGDFAAAQQVEVDKGKVKPSKDDSSINDCLNEERWDVVLLTTKPPANVDVQKTILDCKPGDDRPICTQSKTEFEKGFEALGFTDYFDPQSTQQAEPPSCASAFAVVGSLGAEFNGAGLATLSQEESVDPAVMGSVLNGLRVEVDNDGNWRVKLENQAIMSTHPADSASLWPACPGSCANPLSQKLADIFGAHDASPQSRDKLLQRVTGAIWLMGAMAGQLPQGVFTLPVPARQSFGTDSSTIDSAAVLYGKGVFTNASGQWRLDVADDGKGPVFDDDPDILGVGTEIKSEFAQGATASSRPLWVRQIYQDPSKYLHVFATSAARTFPPQPSLGAFFSKQGDWLAGVKPGACNPAKLEAARSELAKIKLPDQAGKLCMTPDGSAPSLAFFAKTSYVRDVFSYDSDGPQAASDAIPRFQSDYRGTAWENTSFFEKHTIGTQADLCWHPYAAVDGFTLARVRASCLVVSQQVFQAMPPVDYRRYTRRALLPSVCSPSQRAQLFVNSNNPIADGCEIAGELARTLALTCVLGPEYESLAIGGPLPALTKAADIAKLEDWLEQQAKNLRIAMSRLYLMRVPKRVLADEKAGKVGSGSYKGEHGRLVLQYRQHLSTVASNWAGLSKELVALQGAVKNARLALQAAELDKKVDLNNLAMQQIGLYAAMAKAVVGAAAGVVTALVPNGNPAGFFAPADAVIDITAAKMQLSIIQEQEALADQKNANQVLAILNTLHDQTNDHFTNMQQGIEAMEIAVAEAHKTASALEQKENEAKYQLAKGAGADYVLDSNGKAVEFPVNTVLRRQYVITKRRYDAALRQAKYLSYMARLAVEQRIGLRLDEIDETIGALEAPSKWANDVCSFQGVDYERLRKGVSPQSSKLGALIALMNDEYFTKFADPFIGDYVKKLEQFVEYYNIQYPSHEGDDVAVLSIRDDLLGPSGTCYKPARNLLHHSHDLTRADAGEEGQADTVRGWKQAACKLGTGKCLAVTPGSILKLNGAPLEPPGVAPLEGFTWLHDIDPDLSAAGDVGTPGEAQSAPSGTVYQSVALDIGSFALSWFDTARGVTADAAGSGSGSYFAAVYDATWKLIASHSGPAQVPGGGTVWSDRQVIAFAVTTPGKHHIVFAPSLPGFPKGSVAIADVQLEAAASAGAVTAYQATDASRLVLTGDCVEGSGRAFRAAFEYSCNSKSCFHDLRQPFAVNLQALLAGSSALAGKIAQDNYNYRHVNLAINVVGTGVIDCTKTPTPSCFGSPYIEYTLEHDAYSVPIIDHLGHAKEFNFASAGVRFGKGLAAERFITLPIGSGDQALLSQPEFTKVEFRGRPLDGTYRFRVYDSPSLNWNQVEDIQLVLTYRYWSRIDRDSQQK